MNRPPNAIDEVPMEMESTTSPWTELYQANPPAESSSAATSQAADHAATAESRQANAETDAIRPTQDALSKIFNR